MVLIVVRIVHQVLRAKRISASKALRERYMSLRQKSTASSEAAGCHETSEKINRVSMSTPAINTLNPAQRMAARMRPEQSEYRVEIVP